MRVVKGPLFHRSACGVRVSRFRAEQGASRRVTSNKVFYYRSYSLCSLLFLFISPGD